MCVLSACIEIRPVWSLQSQKRPSDLPELELQTAVSCDVWVLGIELVFFGRGASALNHWDISLASRKGLFWLMISSIDFTLIGKTWQQT